MKKEKKRKSAQLRCPYCGSIMDLRDAKQICSGAKTGSKVYVCRNYPACNVYVNTRKGTAVPLGVPADSALRKLRIDAHRAFDRLWKNGIMSRDTAYRWFADYFGLRLGDAHIALCNEYQCRALIRASNQVVSNYRRVQGEEASL